MITTIRFLFIFGLILAAPVAAIDFSPGNKALLLSERAGWQPTGENNSLTRDRTLFYFTGREQRTQLNTDSEQTNIHNHFKNGRAKRLANYSYTGQMKIADADGGIGVTFHSQYNDSDAYYRLRRFSGHSFHIAPHPDGYPLVCDSSDTEVTPDADTWYKFRIVVSSKARKTILRAKVWQVGDSQPRTWQIVCEDQNTEHLRRGKPGVWSMGPGTKSWRKLKIVAK